MTPDPQDYARTAAQERADAALVELLGRAIRDAENLEGAGAEILAIANAKAANADRLTEMAAERLQDSSEGQSA